MTKLWKIIEGPQELVEGKLNDLQQEVGDVKIEGFQIEVQKHQAFYHAVVTYEGEAEPKQDEYETGKVKHEIQITNSNGNNIWE